MPETKPRLPKYEALHPDFPSEGMDSVRVSQGTRSDARQRPPVYLSETVQEFDRRIKREIANLTPRAARDVLGQFKRALDEITRQRKTPDEGKALARKHRIVNSYIFQAKHAIHMENAREKQDLLALEVAKHNANYVRVIDDLQVIRRLLRVIVPEDQYTAIIAEFGNKATSFTGPSPADLIHQADHFRDAKEMVSAPQQENGHADTH